MTPGDMTSATGVRGVRQIGEVIEASTTRYRAESLDLEGAPSFGSFVKTDTRPVTYGLVFNIYTASIDPSRRPTAFGLDEAALIREQPQLFELLRREFEVAAIGYEEGSKIFSYLPPWPPRIHSFVHLCEPQEIRALTEELDFIRTVTAMPGLPSEELVAASIRQACQACDSDFTFLVRAGREVAEILKDEYDKARAIIRRITP